MEKQTQQRMFLRRLLNLTPDAQPVRAGHPAAEREFSSMEAAKSWLAELRCGGAVSYHNGKDWTSIEAEAAR